VLLTKGRALGATLLSGSVVALGGAYVLARWRAESEARVIQGASETRVRLHERVQGISTIKAEHAERSMLSRWLEALCSTSRSVRSITSCAVSSGSRSCSPARRRSA
jgi:ABC-type bacteriocin/lantibiotic exporter with double-glycine peptidase domain